MPPSNLKQSAGRQWLSMGLALLALGWVVWFFSNSFATREKGTDFPEFYAAARIVLEGHGHQLYDQNTQYSYQLRDAQRIGTAFYHPAFETLLFLPFCVFSLKTAYLFWCVFNALLLVLFVWMMERDVFNNVPWPVLLILCLIFPPLLLNFYQGQDSLLLLVLTTAAVRALRNRQDVAAGIFLALGLFKFHLILPFVLLLGCQKRLKALSSFAGTAILLFVVSVGVTGVHFLRAYYDFLTSTSSLPLAGFHPSQMANIRGLIVWMGLSGPLAYTAILLISLMVAFWAIRVWRETESKTDMERHLAAAMFCLATILVGYHLSPHDLTLLLLPLCLIANFALVSQQISSVMKSSLIGCVAILFLPPLYIVLVRTRLFSWMSLPILALFTCVGLHLTGTTRKVGVAV